jgi:hypothetical protein
VGTVALHGPEPQALPPLAADECGADDARVQDDGRCGAWPELAVRLQHRAHQRHQADQRHVRQHDHQEPQPEGRRRIGLQQREQPELADDRDAAQHDRHDGEHHARKPPRDLGLVAVEPRVDGKEGRGERALAEESAEQVRDLEREVEGVEQGPGAERTRE